MEYGKPLPNEESVFQLSKWYHKHIFSSVVNKKKRNPTLTNYYQPTSNSSILYVLYVYNINTLINRVLIFTAIDPRM